VVENTRALEMWLAASSLMKRLTSAGTLEQSGPPEVPFTWGMEGIGNPSLSVFESTVTSVNSTESGRRLAWAVEVKTIAAETGGGRGLLY
jgi:hypothetical protein